MFTWGYLRHFENIRILGSVWSEYNLVPAEARVWDPANGFFLPQWMQIGVFLPIFLLQLVRSPTPPFLSSLEIEILTLS